MKTTYLISSLLALLTLGSCIAPQDEEIDCQDCREQQIAIRLASDNATTRAGRPLYSNQPQQDVDRVMLIFCAGNQIVSTKLIKDWMDISDEYETTDHRGQQCIITLEGSERLPESPTPYTAYAIAYTYKSDQEHTAYTVGEENEGLDTYLTGLNNGDTFSKNLVLTLSGEPGEEIFAGSLSQITINESGGFYQPLVLNRQVAGVYMYVSAIPDIDQAKELRLTAAADNDWLVLGQFDNEDYGQDSKQGNKVVNGTNAKTGEERYTLCSIIFKDWKNEDGSWKNPYEGKATFEDGSYFSGSFVIPFAAQKDVQSLRMELIGNDDDDTELKSWKVNLPGEDISTEIYTWSDNTFAINSSITESPSSYCLLRNHLYCIGSKKTDGSTDGDEPQPLDTGQDIQLKVIAEWDYVYDIMLEPTPGGSK